MPALLEQVAPVATPNGQGLEIVVPGGTVWIKISTAATDGAFAVFEGTTRPLEGPPLHLHREQDEWWYILDGEYRFEVDGQEIIARTGDTVFAPRGSRHTFQNIGNHTGRTLTTVIPGGLDVFFEELEMIAPDGNITDPGPVAALFEKHDLELLGPPLSAR